MDENLGKIVREELSGNIAKSYVAQISRFHRIQASTMFHEAAEYVKSELLKMGLEDVAIEQFLADGAKKYWTYTSPVGWTVRSAELRLLEPVEKLLATFGDIPQCLHAYSNATPAEGIEAELVDVGAGTKAADFEGKSVDGKFVLATGRAKAVHEQAVFKHGAASVITDSVTLEISGVRESLDIPDAHAYQAIWPTAEELGKVKFGFSLSKRQGNQLRALLKRGGPVKLRAKVDAELFPGYLEVVTGTIRGKSNPAEEVFLVAHLCHPKPSANDNASGSGLLLEIARTMNVLIESRRIERPARTIRFLWLPETYGSTAYLCSHEDASSRLVAGVNLDMVGQNQELCKSTLNLDCTPDSLPSYLNDLVFKCMEQSVKEFDKPSPFGSSSIFRYASGPFSGGSDHAEFTDSTVGVPCVMLLQWPDLFYHTSMDTIDKVSEDSLRRVGWIATNAVLTIANANCETAFQLGNETASKGMARIEDAEREAVDNLFRKRQGPQLKNEADRLALELQKTTLRFTRKIEHIAWREKEAVKSVKRLSSNPEVSASIEEQCRLIGELAKQEITRLNEALMFVAKAAVLTLSNKSFDVQEKELKAIPKRLFKGTLGTNFLKEVLGEKELEWLEQARERDRDFDKKAAEALNFMDGERSVYDIVQAVSSEYSETNPEYMLKFLQDLEKAGLIRLY